VVQAVITGWSTGSGFDLAWFSSHLPRASVSLVFMVLCIFSFFVIFFALRFNDPSLVDWPFTWLCISADTIGWVI